MRDLERADRLADYLSGSMDRAERAAFEAEIVASPELAAELYAAQGTLDALGSLRTPRARPRRRWAPRAIRWALPVAAVLAAVMILPRWLTSPNPVDAPVFRGGEALLTLEPFGPVESVPTVFRWTAIGAAAQYRFELYDLDQERIWSRVTADTVLHLEDERIRAAILEGGMWKVVPVDPAGIELPSSPPGWFTVLAP